VEIYIRTNAPDVAKRFEELVPYIRQHQIELFGELGEAFVANVRKRIQTQDDGSWQEVSKWVRAKKGVDVPLKGADRFVHWRASEQEGASLRRDGRRLDADAAPSRVRQQRGRHRE
jgi:hypothetical protein